MQVICFYGLCWFIAMVTPVFAGLGHGFDIWLGTLRIGFGIFCFDSFVSRLQNRFLNSSCFEGVSCC